MDSADIAWWSLGVAGLALLMSIINSVWQYRDARRRRTPDVVVSARFWPGAGVGAERYGDPVDDRLLADVHVSGSATVVGGGIAPPKGNRGWTELLTVAHEAQGGRAVPVTVENGSLAVWVDLPKPLPPGMNGDDGARLWVRTSTGHRYVSPVVRPLRQAE